MSKPDLTSLSCRIMDSFAGVWTKPYSLSGTLSLQWRIVPAVAGFCIAEMFAGIAPRSWL
jgi:hypothetical protein